MKKLTIEILVPDSHSHMLTDDLMENFCNNMDMTIISDEPELPIFMFHAYEGLLINWSLKDAQIYEKDHYNKVFELDEVSC